jgi:hypothetical protein
VDRRVREAALDDIEQKLGALARIAVDLRLVSELEADEIVAQPAHGAFECGPFAELELKQIPKAGSEVAADHRAARREVHNLHIMHFAHVASGCGLGVQPVAVAASMIPAADFVAPYDRTFESVVTSVPKALLVGANERGALPADHGRAKAVSRGLGRHAPAYAAILVTKSCCGAGRPAIALEAHGEGSEKG